jgi:DNA polymerase-3 subunit alpha
MCTDVHTRTTKNGDLMATLTLEDMKGLISVVVFPKTYDKYTELIRDDEKVFIRGRYDDTDDRGAKLIASDIMSFEEASRKKPGDRTSGYAGKTPGDAGNKSGKGSNAPGYRNGSDAPESGGRKYDSKIPEKVPRLDAANVKQASSVPGKGLFIRFENMDSYKAGLPLLSETLKAYPGDEACIVFISSEKRLKSLEEKVKISDDLLGSLFVLFGKSNVAVK